ncbi:MAG: RIP metalloprotease RseP [Candidatus Omnitrophota bacterium]
MRLFRIKRKNLEIAFFALAVILLAVAPVCAQGSARQAQPAPTRIMEILVTVLILSVLIVAHEFGHFIMARKVGVRVEKFSLGFGPKLFSRKVRDTEYILSAIPLGGFVKLAGDDMQEYTGKPDEYFSKSIFERFKIIFFGPLLNYAAGFLFFWLIFFTGYPTLTNKIGGFVDNSTAEASGLRLEDEITAVDGKNISSWVEIVRAIQAKKSGEKVSLSFLRGGKEEVISVPVKEEELSDATGAKHKIGLIGIGPKFIRVRHGLFAAFFLGLGETWNLTLLTYKGLWMMLSGELSIKNSVTGLLGIYVITSRAVSAGMTAVLHLFAILSISLGLFNILPFPVLDGGHMFFLLLEKIRGKALSAKVDAVLTRLGMSLLIFFVVLVTYNDVLRFFGERIAKLFDR